jgi:hypothetical protein
MLCSVVVEYHHLGGCSCLHLQGEGDLLPESRPLEVKIAIEGLKKYKLPSINQILAELIQAGSNTLYSKIHKLIKSIWNKEELP